MDHIQPKNIIHLVFSVILGAVFFIGLTTPISIIPPLGDFVNPSSGIWNVATNAEHPEYQEINIPDGLTNTVTIYRDTYGVPHIYAENDNDLYFAQGYVHAQDRLWQLESQRRLFSGQLAEVLGEDLLDTDRFYREIGLYRSSKKSLELLNQNSELKEGIQSYTDGINYYIDNLNDRDLPFEFKILNFKPSNWNVVDTLAFGKLMAFGLSYSDSEIEQSTICSAFSTDEYRELFPYVRPYQTPIIPDFGSYYMPEGYNWRGSTTYHNSTTDPTLEEECNTVPQFLKDATTTLAQIQVRISSIETPFGKLGDPFIGSNNWVVSGNFTDTGKPYLANDAHLGHSLPPIWYQNSLHSIGTANEEYHWWGFSFIGVPMIIIGHNQYAAWGFTNVGADAIDWYYFKENVDGTQYYYDGEFRNYVMINETIKVKGGPDQIIQIKEVRQNGLYGPLVSLDNTLDNPLVMQWTGYNASTIFSAIYNLNRVENVIDYQEALKTFDVPGQNVVFADIEGNIALRVTGFYPIRTKGNGRFVVNASADPDMNRWEGLIPFNKMPYSVNPSQGYIQSANQQSVGPDYIPYLSSDQAPGYRGRRIDNLLHQGTTTGDNKITLADFQQFQMDNFDTSAEAFVPKLITASESGLASEYNIGISTWGDALTELDNWDYIMNREESSPLIYWFFLNEFREQTFLDEYNANSVEDLNLPRPEILEYFTTENIGNWFDDVSTSLKVETRDDILLRSLKNVLIELEEDYGSEVSEWKWGEYHRLNVEHQVGGDLSDNPRPWDGSQLTLNAAGNNNEGLVGGGPSERAIYDLSDLSDDLTNSITTLPGGQSGNPLSKHYKDFLELWYTYQYYPMHWFLTVTTFPENLKESTLILKGGE